MLEVFIETRMSKMYIACVSKNEVCVCVCVCVIDKYT